MADRDNVEDAIWNTLAQFDLDDYTDDVMDSLDAVIDWDEDDESD